MITRNVTDRAQTDAAATLLMGLACSFYDEILKSSLGPAESSLKKDAMLYNLKSDSTIFIQDWIFSEDTEGKSASRLLARPEHEFV